MSNQLEKINPSDFGLEPSNVETIESAFMPKIAEREALKEIYSRIITSEIDNNLCKEAGDVRRKLVKVRTGIAEIHKTQKAFYLAAGRFVDAWKNKETEPIEQMEEALSAIENHFEIIENKRKDALRETRAKECEEYSEFIPLSADLRNMSDEDYALLLNGAKLQLQAKKDAEAKAEAERLEAIRLEQERIEAQRIENERLKKEAAEREAAIEEERKEAARLKAIEDAKIEAERKEAARLQAIENERIEKEREAERAEAKRLQDIKDKEIAEAEAKRLAAERLLKEKEAEEQRLKREAEEKAEAELSKGDKEKLQSLIDDLEALKTKYTFKSKKYQETQNGINDMLSKIITWTKSKNQ